MFEEFFERYGISDPEIITEEQSENIKAALQKKLAADNSPSKRSDEEKEKDIMKTKSIRTIIIAAAVAVAGLAGAVGATSAILTSKEIAADLATKNNVTPEWVDKVSDWEENSGKEIHATPTYEYMEVNEFAVREAEYGDFKGWDDEDFPAIIFQHLDEWGGFEQLITYDGNGGYLYDGEPVTDEKLLAAIAEGTEKYGDTFVIQY